MCDFWLVPLDKPAHATCLVINSNSKIQIQNLCAIKVAMQNTNFVGLKNYLTAFIILAIHKSLLKF